MVVGKLTDGAEETFDVRRVVVGRAVPESEMSDLADVRGGTLAVVATVCRNHQMSEREFN
jgi:hypothetical protein